MIGIYAWLAGVHWGRVGNWALAICTLLLAFFTWRVSRAAIKTLEQNNKIIESEERHHQENLRPICVFQLIRPGAEVFNITFPGIRAFIENKGLGTSIEGELYLLLPSILSYLSIKFPTLGRGEKWIEAEQFSVHHKIMEKSKFIPLIGCNASYAGAIQKAFTERNIIIIIKYRDLFGNHLITEQIMDKTDGQFSINLRYDNKVPISGYQCINPQ